MECVTCGGTEFITESGFYYCVDCQTQSQEVREHVFQQEVTNVKSGRKINTVKAADKPDNKVTSWECYNIIMCGLTQELVKLGAKSNFKRIVRILWMRYLEKLEVLNFEKDARPKFQAVNLKRDAAIVFNIKKSRKRRKSEKSDTDDSLSHDTTSFKRERTKKKRALAQAQYDEYSMKSTQETNTSLMNETLISLKSSEKSDSAFEITFNRPAREELRKRMSKDHTKLHATDVSFSLQCHRLSYSKATRRYKYGVTILSPNKLYAILYLGLLINHDSIQLGDMLRFAREGHLSFNNHEKLFPEEYKDRTLGIANNQSKREMSHRQYREVSAKMAAFLDVTSYVEVPDLPALCKRYCDEMNLPNDIYNAVRILLAKTKPSMVLKKTDKAIPNYEGRCMSLILFVLKLMYGLDGITEFHLSEYAEILNDGNMKLKMFNFQKWLEYIGYRRLVITENHFPTAYKDGSPVDSNLFLQYVNSHNISFETNKKLTKEVDDYKQVLEKLKDAQHDYITFVEYSPSLTPFLKYSEIISSIYKGKYLRGILDANFRNQSMDHLMNPNKYLQLMNDGVVKRNRGANENWIIDSMATRQRTSRCMNRSSHNLVPVMIVKEEDSNSSRSSNLISSGETETALPNRDILTQKQFKAVYGKHFKRNEKFLNSLVETEIDDSIKINSNSYSEHYQPYERYWMNFIMNLDTVSAPSFQNFFQKYPSTLKILVSECCRILEATPQEFCREFISTELYLLYVLNCNKRNDLSNQMKHYISSSQKQW